MAEIGGLDSSREKSDFWSQPAILAVTAAALLLLTTYRFTRRENRSRHRLPPGPSSWSFIGNRLFRRAPPRQGPRHRGFFALAKKYGPIFTLRLGSVKAVVVCSSRYAEEVLKNHDHAFASRRRTPYGTIVGYDSQTIGQSPYGPYWRHIRKVMALELLTAKRLRGFQDLRRREVLCTLQAILDGSKGGKAVSVRQHLRALTRNNITQMIVSESYFGPNSGASSMKGGHDFMQAMANASEMLGRIIPEDIFPILRFFDVFGIKQKMKSARKEVDQVFDRIIAEHRGRLVSHGGAGSDSDRLDVVDALLTRPGGDGETPLDDNQVKALLLSIYLAGTETSSGVLEWTLAALLRNPPVLKRAQDELDAVVGQNRLVEESDLPQLEYLQAIVKESLRLYPVAPMLLPHYSTEACEVGEFLIPRNSLVLVHVAAINTDPDTWDRALDFYPDRFLTNAIDLHGQHLDFIPFGSGRRICPGKTLGLLIVQYALAVLLHGADWKLPEGMTPNDVDLTENDGSVVLPSTPFEAVATPRLPPRVIHGDHEPAAT